MELLDERPTARLVAASPPRSRRRPVRTAITPARALMLAALVLWLASLPGLRSAPTHPLGLLFANGPGYAISVALAILAFCVAIRHLVVRSTGSADAIAALLLVVSVIRLPVSLLADLPIYGWTYKHLGVIDYLSTTGHVTTGIDIYSGWPGLFAIASWFGSLTGLTNLEMAQWFAFVYHLALGAAIFAFARSLRLPFAAALVATFISEIVNWVAQDYLSPQAFAFLLAIIVLTLLVRSRQDPIAGWLSVPVFAAVVVTHQLTPFWLVGVALVLGVTGNIRPRYIGIVFGALAGGWLLLNLDAVQGHELISAGDPITNAQTTASAGAATLGHTITASAGKIAPVMLWGGALVVLAIAARPNLRRMFARTTPLRRRFTLATPQIFTAAVIGFTSFGLLAGQNYGGEAIFRVFLYSIPGCAVLVAPTVTRLLTRSVRGFLIALTLVLAAGVGSLQAYYGAWYANLVDQVAYDASLELTTTQGTPLNILAPVPASPSRFTADYVDFARANPSFDTSILQWNGWGGSSFDTSAQITRLTDDLLWENKPVAFFVTSQMEDYSDFYGLYPTGAIDRMIEQLRADGRWTFLTDTPDVRVLLLEIPHD